MKEILKKSLNTSISLLLILIFLCSFSVTVFAQEAEFATTQSNENKVLFTYDSDIYAGSTMRVDSTAMKLSKSALFAWYRDGKLYAKTEGVTLLESDIDCEFYVTVTEGDIVYKSYSFFVVKAHFDYGFSMLSEKHQKLYCAMLDGISNYETEIPLNEEDCLTFEDFEYVNTVFYNDHPELFWYLGSSYVFQDSVTYYLTSLEPVYVIDNVAVGEKEIKQAQAKVKNKAFSMMAQMHKDVKISTEYKNALWVHDTVASTITYAASNNDQSIYGALLEGKSVCSGYARLNHYLLNLAGIDAYTLTGMSLSPNTNKYETHAWNLMWLDHHCLYTDVTWDDQKNHTFHLYFARTLDNMSINHIMDDVSDSVKPQGDDHCCEYNYFAYYHEDHALYADEDGSFDPQEIANLKDEKIKNKAWGIVVYDQSGEDFVKWLTSDISTNLSDILYAMDIPPATYAISYVKMGGGTLGTETHIYFESKEESVKYYTLRCNIESFGAEEDVLTVRLYKNGSTDNPQQKNLTGTSTSYDFTSLEAGEYTVEVEKDGHVTSKTTITINGNKSLDFDLHLYGDSDLDGNITVMDATNLQRALVSIVSLDDTQKACCDADKSGKIEITDATIIQQYCAGIIHSL